MTTTRHTPIPTPPPKIAANAATFNAPLSQLDSAIGAVVDDVSTIMVQQGAGGWYSILDAQAASGQMVVPVATPPSADAVNASVYIGTPAAGEAFEIASVQAGVSITSKTNLGATYASGTPISIRPAGVLIGQDTNAKPSGNGMSGFPIEWAHNDASGYLLHLLSGATMSGGAMIGIGVGDTACASPNIVGLLISNKLKGEGMALNNEATITDATAYGLHGYQNSTLAPLLFLEQTAAPAAPLLTLASQGTASAGQKLAEFFSVAGGSTDFGYRVGVIYADNGRLDWYKDIRADGSKLIALVADNVSANQSQVHVDGTSAAWHTYTGTPGSYYHWRVAGSVSGLIIESSDTYNIGSEVWDRKAIEFDRVGNATRLGFFGATPAAKPTGVAVTDAGIHAALVTLGLIAA